MVPPPIASADALASPIAFWFWNGDLRIPELNRQLGLMRESGIYQFVIHARKGFGSDASGLKTKYLSEEWFEACRAVIEEAARTGMLVWIYDEVNWPSGSSGGAVTVGDGLSEYHIAPDGSLSQDFDSETRRELSPDFLSRRSAEAFIAHTHEEYARRFRRYFGTTVLGMFNDEIRLANAEPWSPDLPDHRGMTVAGRVRACGRAFREAYLRTLADWCSAHGLKLMGHAMGEESLGSQVRYLGGDLASMIGIFHVPGIDHLGDKAEGLQPVYLASAAYLKGANPATMCETGAALPWDMAETDLRRISGWLYAQGVHRQVLHGFFYEANPKDWPPDMFFRWKGWAGMKRYAAWASRIHALRDRLVPIYKVALYFPVEEFIDDYRPDPAYLLDYQSSAPIGGPKALALHRSMQALPNALKRRNIDFIFVPKGELGKAKDMILLIPAGCDVDFPGRRVEQGHMTAEAAVAMVADLLPDRPVVEGPGSERRPLPVRDDIADPYLHTERDEGGVVLKSYFDGGRRVFSVWNAEPTAFRGFISTGAKATWSIYDPQRDELSPSPDAETARVRLDIEPYSFAYLIEE